MPLETLETTGATGGWMPPVNIGETKDSYLISAELPGLARDDIQVTYHHGLLAIRGERQPLDAEPDTAWHRVERGFGVFERCFQLPASVCAEQIRADYEAGVLTLTLPKLEAVRPTKIAIKVCEADALEGGLS
jgi:HSP20 family protein